MTTVSKAGKLSLGNGGSGDRRQAMEFDIFSPERIRPVQEYVWKPGIFRLPRRPTVRILVVVDGWVGLDPDYYFGVGKMIEILRKSAPHADPEFKYVNIDVDTATRDASPIAGTADLVNFRFNQLSGGVPLIDRYDQIWCFGFHPGTSGDAMDAPIEANGTRLDNDELKVLTTWMNTRRGGLLAMGDHHFLGATMCWKIPRVRSMRRWTNADGVPPINSPIAGPGGATRYRHDTNQPQNSAQADPAASAEIPLSAESDGIPQKIEVRNFGNKLFRRPHPILCDQLYGRIDVLPDHPHEGWVYDDAEVPVGNAYDFGGGVAGPDFPPAVDGGPQPLPQAIAWANPFPEPPWDHAKAPTPVTRFPVIGAYDGHRANVGRVVVDATWHHWFNMNIDGIHAQASDPGATAEQRANWHKIKTYFRNVAVWLSPPAKQRSMLVYSAFWSLGSGLSVENYDGGMPSWELGETARDVMGQMASHCMTLSWIQPLIPIRIRDMILRPRPSPCLTCPPFTMFEDAVLGGIIKAMLPERDRLFSDRLRGGIPAVQVEALAKSVEAGALQGLTELHKHWNKSLEHSRELLAAMVQPAAPKAARKADPDFAQVMEDLELEEDALA